MLMSLQNVFEDEGFLTMETESGPVEVSNNDSMKLFLKKYREYLQRYTALYNTTRERSVKMVADIQYLNTDSVSLITGTDMRYISKCN